MKTIATYTMLFINTIFIQAQTINIPDINFKNKLLGANTYNTIALNFNNSWVKIDTNNDGEIQISEAALIKQLNLDESSLNLNISNFTGLEYFVNLKTITCNHNNLTSFNFPTLTQLEWLDCSGNQITNLDTTLYPNLKTLYCVFNPISSIDLSSLQYLEAFNCNSTQITTLDFRNNPMFTSLTCANSSVQTIYLKNGINQNHLHKSFFVLVQLPQPYLYLCR